MSEQQHRLFLLDAFALIYRAYFAFARNPLINSKGQNVSAISGFTSTLHELIKKENPSHIAVVFDAPGGTFRSEQHEFYKANREEMPEDIRSAIPHIKAIIEAFNIPMIQLEGYEADDLIGTLAKQKEQEGFKVFMVTPDKDYAQLVSENIFMYKPARSGKDVEVIGIPEVQEQWNVKEPEQVIDILAMWGDAVDNIPGIPGIGEKTAKKLVGQFGSLEAVIENVDELKGKMKENVTNFAEQGLVSKMLATIILDCPIAVENKDLNRDEPNTEKLAEIFKDLEFRSLGRRILGDDFSINAAPKAKPSSFEGTLFGSFEESGSTNTESGKALSNTKHDYQLIEGDEAIKKLVADLIKSKAVAFDTETTGLDANNCEIVGMSFSNKANWAVYVPLPVDQAETKRVLQLFEPFWTAEKCLKIGQNIKYDLLVLNQYGIEVALPYFDTMVAHYLMEPDKRHKMDYLAETYLGYTPVPIEDLIGKKGKGQKSMRDIPIELIKDYAAEDADITFQLYEIFDKMLTEREARDLFEKLEIPLIPVLTRMEAEGVKIDSQFLADYSKEMATDLLKVRQSVFDETGVEFNLDSPKQLGDVLFNQMQIPYTGKKTKTGQFSTNEEVLSKLANDFPLAERILEYREIKKLKSTYVDTLPQQVNPKTGRVHSTFNQTIAATGRLSSINPNLQNIPIRSERGRRIRKAFVPGGTEFRLLAADYSQVELRLVAELSGDEAMTAAFVNGEDIHSSTAAKVYGVSIDDVTSEMRRKAKMVNFGIIYAISAFGLSQRLRIPRKEAKELIDEYFRQYPNIKSYMESTVESAKEKGYVETIRGRRRYLKDINSANHTVRSAAEREAVNAPVQGSAADLIKVAMINIHDQMKKEKMRSKMTLQVHDELVFDAHTDEIDTLKPMVVEQMQNAIKLNVPIVVDIKDGANWLEAH